VPSFVINPRNRTVKKGFNVTLEAKIDGNPTPRVSIKWLNIHEVLYSTTDDQFLYQYNLQNVQSSQSSSYTFYVISEFHGVNISQTAFITILGR
jgi:hypothetical protein